VELLGDTFENCVGIEEESVPAGGVVILFPHLSFLFLLEGTFLFQQISVFFLNDLLILCLFACANHLPDVLQGGLDMNDSPKNDPIVTLAKSSQSLLRLVECQKAVSFVLSIVFFG
jgi:hypothetical protein